MSRGAHPFDGLLGVKLGRKPKPAERATIVVNGRKVKTVSDIASAAPEPEDAEAIASELRRARNRARYQADRQNPEAMAKRKAWYEANRDKVRAYKKQWDEKNKDRCRAAQNAWAKRDYVADPDKHRQRQRAYYQRNREKILAKLKEKRDAAKAARAEKED
ncbi:MAG: hypothetical protein ACK44A_03590 [Roseateles sp.]